jgi:hypothetical protein
MLLQKFKNCLKKTSFSPPAENPQHALSVTIKNSNSTTMHIPTFRYLLSFVISVTIFGSSFAQSGAGTIVLDADAQRQVITADAPAQSIQLKHLKMGETYVVVIPPDVALGACLPSISLLESTATFLQYDAAKHLLRFKAIAPTAQLTFNYPCSWVPADPPRHYVSIACEGCSTKINASNTADMAVLTVENAGVEELIRDVFIGGDCFDVTNISFSGNGEQIGKFSQGASNIGFASGLIMASGDISIAPGPNNLDGAGGGGSSGGDNDLGAIATGSLFDVGVIEFDFTPTQTPLTFSYAFASEEYCEYVNTMFNDVFGFFISGPGISGTQNLAVIPTTNTPVSINTINHVTNALLYTPNTPAGLNNCENGGVSGSLPPQPVATGMATVELQYDGFTKEMIAVAQVIPCSTYHIKLAIGDVGDGVWDSAVFLKAGSFDGGGNAAIDWIVNGDPDINEVVEGTGAVQILIDRLGGNPAIPLPVSFTVTGTATSGADFSPIPFTIVIPAGQGQVLIPVNIIADQIPEGAETIILTLNSACSCLSPQKTLTILDVLPTIILHPDTIVICGAPGTGTIGVTVEGGQLPYTYLWSDGSMLPTLTATVDTTTSFSVTVTDANGASQTAVALIIVSPVPSAELISPLPQLCQGQSTTITVNFTGTGPFVLTYAWNGTATTIPDITANPYLLEVNQLGTYNIVTVLDSTGCPGAGSGAVFITETIIPGTGAQTISLCSGDTVIIAGNVYTEAGTVVDTITVPGGCDSIVTYTLIQLPQETRSEVISFCPGESVTLGGVTYTQSTTVVLNLPGTVGCDTLVTYKLDLLPENTRVETIQFCPGDSVTLGGTVYTQPGIVVLILPAISGCDTVVTYTLEYLVPAPSTVIINCPPSLFVNVPSGTIGSVVTYHGASASSDCPCPGLDITQSEGFASGSTFPMGNTQVCFTARDICGQTKSCCFNVSVAEENPCDVKVNGCMKYELLTITQDQLKKKTYRIRVTNYCADEMTYTAIQVPNGLVATFPPNNTIYTGPGGHDFMIRNPNYSPFYSVRYSSVGVGIANGESDILRYTLPPLASVTYIHIMSRLFPLQTFEAHLNTFYCPVGVTPVEERTEETPHAAALDLEPIVIFPNPTDGSINVDLAAWEGESVQVRVFNSQGQRVLHLSTTATFEPQRIDLPLGIADGLYILDVSTAAGDKEVVKFVVRH